MGDMALQRFRSHVELGADILDIGAESTRPHAQVLSAQEEWDRLGPCLQTVASQPWRDRVRVSVDTRHATTASAALGCGVDIINDVTGLTDPDMREVLRAHSCDIVVMHALTVPVDPSITLPPGVDPVVSILTWKAQITHTAQQAGISPERLIFDPGIGFGKTPAQSLRLIHGASDLMEDGSRWLFGHSRKSFLRLFTDQEASYRDDLTLSISAQLAAAGVYAVRVHAVDRHYQLWRALAPTWASGRSEKSPPPSP